MYAYSFTFSGKKSLVIAEYITRGKFPKKKSYIRDITTNNTPQLRAPVTVA